MCTRTVSMAARVFLASCLWILLLHTSICTGYQRRSVIAFFQKTCASTVPNPCEQVCKDIMSGGFYCECHPGFSINTDGMTCSESPDAGSPGADQVQDNSAKVPPGENEVIGSSSAPDPVKYNSNGEVVISDNDVVHVKSIDLTKGLFPLESAQMKTDTGFRLGRRVYDITEEGLKPNHVYLKFDKVNVVEAGVHDSNPLHTNEVELLPSKKELPPLSNSLSCLGVVCENNGTCAVVESTAVCLCPLGTYGSSCERNIEVKYPRFLGTGYLGLPILRNAHKEFRVVLEFRPESPNGLVLFSGELTSAETDFFSVVLDDGIVVYRFDCGTGFAELRTPNRVGEFAWNKLVITRVDNRGTVRLNSGQEIEDVSPGNYTSITFRLNLYLGGYSDMSAITSRVATRHQFVGCVQMLLINGHRFDFRERGLVGDSEFGVNVGECSEGICDNVVCMNGGTCTAKSADTHVCLCPMGFHGQICDRDSPVHIPHFSGHSYLEFPGLQRSVLSFTEIEIVFKPTSMDGTLLYNGNSRDRNGDFISLSLHDGHLEFKFDLGTGPAIIRSNESLAMNVWHLIKASRTGLMGTLYIDGQVQMSGQSEGAYTQLTLLDSLYLGGHPDIDHISRHTNTTWSFTGCLQKVAINKKTLNLLGQAVKGVNIGPCSHPCAGRPCMNGGECLPRLDTYKCHCHLGFSNTNCEHVQLRLPTEPMFSGESYLVYKDTRITNRVSGDIMDLQIHIRPYGRDGLLFWSGEDMSNQQSQDFIAIGFHSGSLQLRYNLGSGEAMIGYNDSRLFDGQWHVIRVQRNKQNAFMEVDNTEIVEGSSPGEYTSLNTNNIVYLGGMPDIGEKTGGRFTSGFEGCAMQIILATNYVVMPVTLAHTGRNVENCRTRV